jgi:hypothetical protein
MAVALAPAVLVNCVAPGLLEVEGGALYSSVASGVATTKTITGNDGNTYTLTPAEIKQIDPLHIGLNQGFLNILQKYPVGNDPTYGADGGYSFTGFRFNAPNDLDNRVYVGKFDAILDNAGHHTLSFRGTLSNANQDNPVGLAQFPGQAPASIFLNNSKGMAATYTAVLSSNLINTLIYGFTRQGVAQSGTVGDQFTMLDIDPLQNYNIRAQSPLTTWPTT